MALADFQRALADMALDARLAAAVRAAVPEALDGYALNDRESQRLFAVAQQDGMSLNCSLARANRFTSIHDAFSMTCVLLRPHLRDLLDELWSERRPSNYQLSGEEEAFARLVEQAIDRGALQNEYLAEVFQYERACWCLAMELRLRDAASMEGRTQVTRFRHDPAALFDALSQGELPAPGLPQGNYEVTVGVTKGDVVAEWDAI